MHKIALIFWPEGGNVEGVADKIVAGLPGIEVNKISLSKMDARELADAGLWIIGGSTVGAHIWQDADDSNRWLSFFKMLDQFDMKAKTVAFFGLGDQVLYPYHFVNGLGILQEEFEKRNTRIIGQWPVNGYEFKDSDGMKDGMFFGLALDEDQQEEATDERIAGWLKLITSEIGK
ncbi:MAG: flavodoxin FldA [Bacteroidetes bacterium]|nr:flavodoxin FldA [Bacteroidota bacterium]